jgi:hypothetical protein
MRTREKLIRARLSMPAPAEEPRFGHPFWRPKTATTILNAGGEISLTLMAVAVARRPGVEVS